MAETSCPSGQPVRLWLAVFLPRLPLEVIVPAGTPAALALAVFEESGRETRIVTVSAGAEMLGVAPGMSVNGALALAPALGLLPRRPALEAAALDRLAAWAGSFTPAVSCEGGNSLLLEIGSSLRLFGGLGRLRARLRHDLQERGHEVQIACTPTPRASLWLARAGQAVALRTYPELQQALANISVAHLGWPAKSLKLLRQMGLTTLGDCVRLPRQGFARRLGPSLLREIDQAYGRVTDLRRPCRLPDRFEQSLELPAETTDSGRLLEGFRILSRDLHARLVSCQASVASIWCRLMHPDGGETRLQLALRQPAGVAPLPELLRLRLESLVLPAVVSSLVLQAELLPGGPPAGRDLLGDELTPDGELTGLLARLRARLGHAAVQGLALVPDHRPERAWRALENFSAARPASADDSGASRERPVWLLPAPEPLGQSAGRPAWRGVLCLERGPERIESGWWDGGDVRRDYYLASNPHGALLWIYRDLRSQAWYLHGIFG